MEHISKRVILILLTLALLLSLSAVSAFAGAQVEVEAEMVSVDQRASDGQQIYKLVFSAYSEYGISVMSTVMSYDNTLIVPVEITSFVDVDDYIVIEPSTSYAHKLLLATPRQIGSPIPYSVAGVEWVVNGTRTGVLYDFSSTTPIISMSSKQAVLSSISALRTVKQ